MKIVYIIGMCMLIILVGCKKEIDCTAIPTNAGEKWLKDCTITQTNSTWITTETYNGTLFYCFINNSYYGDSCFPYTNSTKENVIDYEITNYENTTNYQICEIINETIKECFDEGTTF